MESPAELGARVRDLRLQHELTQGRLAKVLGVSVPSISAWESEKKRDVPKAEHLAKYALLFCTARSFADGDTRLLDPAELTEEERGHHARLRIELGLVEAVVNPLRFPAGELLTVVCAQLPVHMRAAKEYADPLDPDHVEMYNFADIDALFELYSYLRQVNPDNPIRYKLVNQIDRRDLDSHLMLLGGVDWNTLTRQLLDRLRLPVAQVPREGIDAGAFEVVDDDGAKRTLVPVLKEEDGRLTLREDVAHLCRAPNPFSRPGFTVTIFNGMYGRGTHGIVRALTDVDWRDNNYRYLHGRFGDASTFSLVSRVEIVAGVVTVPDWTDPHNRLHEWPPVSP
ncbi:helix-turn-helix domain-containing protein [Dactylosporangium sp. NPDC051541]|uniref:helix-turn-helix domain-containing protein n=1 Tax=Dactylosporangium sp. NPDC051541 TaxID=3363977 RepID=UPI00379B0786